VSINMKDNERVWFKANIQSSRPRELSMPVGLLALGVKNFPREAPL
jgi:hypothetical protein